MIPRGPVQYHSLKQVISENTKHGQSTQTETSETDGLSVEIHVVQWRFSGFNWSLEVAGKTTAQLPATVPTVTVSVSYRL